MSKPKPKYSEDYLKFGFTSVLNNIEVPQCVLCLKTLGNDSLKQSLLSRHLEKAHPSDNKRDLEFFKCKETSLKKRQIDSGGSFHQQSNAAVKASYEVALMIAKQKKPYTIREDIILPAAKEMVCSVIGNDAAKKLNQISLSNNTVQHQIEEMSLDILEQVVIEIHKSPVGFAIQLESTDVANCSQLLVFVQYV